MPKGKVIGKVIYEVKATAFIEGEQVDEQFLHFEEPIIE